MRIPQLMTIRQVATELGVSRQAVEQWIRKGKMPAFQPNGWYWLIRKQDCKRPIPERPGRKPQA